MPQNRPTTRRRRRLRGERGYVMILSALLILPLLAFAGFATDVGSWYSQASRMQRAADAAALAGVVWLPDAVQAEATARDVATRNGFTDGVDDISVTVTQIGPDRLNVLIEDPEADLFFADLVIKSVEIKRTATAEYVLPLPMGSPENTFGNAQYASYPGKPNFFAAISGPYTQRSQGDNIATKCINSTGYSWCSGATNASYDETGYYYAVEVPPGATNVDVAIFDAGFQNRPSPLVETGDYRYGKGPWHNGVSTQYTLYQNDLTPLTHLDNPPMTSGACGGTNPDLRIYRTWGTGVNNWTSLCNIAAPAPGIYPLQVKSSDISGWSDRGFATNQFSVRAEANGGAGPQPRVYGIGRMSIFAEANAGATEFFLADIQPIHAGKSLRVELFDPGESTDAADLTILGPLGVPVDCVVSVDSGPPTIYSPCNIQTTTPGGTALFNGSRLTIDFSLPLTYTCGADCWWKVQYNYTANAHDRTTWTASILGDPVHLVRADGNPSP